MSGAYPTLIRAEQRWHIFIWLIFLVVVLIILTKLLRPIEKVVAGGVGLTEKDGGRTSDIPELS